jgi:hypothetical protein
LEGKKNPGGASAQTGSGSATSFAKKQKDFVKEGSELDELGMTVATQRAPEQ